MSAPEYLLPDLVSRRIRALLQQEHCTEQVVRGGERPAREGRTTSSASLSLFDATLARIFEHHRNDPVLTLELLHPVFHAHCLVGVAAFYHSKFSPASLHLEKILARREDVILVDRNQDRSIPQNMVVFFVLRRGGAGASGVGEEDAFDSADVVRAAGQEDMIEPPVVGADHDSENEHTGFLSNPVRLGLFRGAVAASFGVGFSADGRREAERLVGFLDRFQQQDPALPSESPVEPEALLQPQEVEEAEDHAAPSLAATTARTSTTPPPPPREDSLDEEAPPPPPREDFINNTPSSQKLEDTTTFAGQETTSSGTLSCSGPDVSENDSFSETSGPFSVAAMPSDAEMSADRSAEAALSPDHDAPSADVPCFCEYTDRIMLHGDHVVSNAPEELSRRSAVEEVEKKELPKPKPPLGAPLSPGTMSTAANNKSSSVSVSAAVVGQRLPRGGGAQADIDAGALADIDALLVEKFPFGFGVQCGMGRRYKGW